LTSIAEAQKKLGMSEGFDVALEMSSQMRLIVEANVRCYLRNRLSLEQAPSGSLHSASHQVAVWSDRERAREAPHEMCR